MSVPAAPNAYDLTPYPSYSHEQTYPDRLAAVATLYGMTPAPTTRCRVLEIGCASGANLLPMAFALPESTFVGIDLAGRQIAKGQERIGRVGLRNVTLHQRDILEIGAELGTFDYIMAHGIYSWVPAPVRDRLLAVCRELLAPEGVAYVSYNVWPGCHFRQAIRGVMRFHTRRLSDPSARVAQARSAAAFFAEAAPAGSRYKELLQAEQKRLEGKGDESLLHDDLSEINEPLYFHEFAEHAGRHRLQYLGEARFHLMFDQGMSPEVQAAIRQAGDVVVYEQYLDFVRGRAFRETLLCREEVALERLIDPLLVTRLSAEALLTKVPDALDLRSRAPVQFVSTGGVGMSLSAPIGKAALSRLAARAPEALTFQEILRDARALLGDGAAPEGEAAEEEERELAAVLLGVHAAGGVALWPRRVAPVTHAGERPMASPVARLQADEGIPVTGIHHRQVAMDEPLSRELLRHLDGKRTRAELVDVLVNAAVEGRVPLRDGDTPVEGQEAARRFVEEHLEQMLAKIARLGVLVA